MLWKIWQSGSGEGINKRDEISPRQFNSPLQRLWDKNPSKTIVAIIVTKFPLEKGGERVYNKNTLMFRISIIIRNIKMERKPA
jgi:hypothetical protein